MTSDWQNMRTSDADRQRAADVLKAAVAEGRLTPEEHGARLDRVLSARTYGELQQLTADLPSGPTPFGPPQPAPQPTLYAYPTHPPVQLPPPMPPARPVNGMATASLVFGIISFFTYGLTSVPAIIAGHVGRSKIRTTQESGEVRAKVGLVLGYLGLALLLVRIVTYVGFGL